MRSLDLALTLLVTETASIRDMSTECMDCSLTIQSAAIQELRSQAAIRHITHLASTFEGRQGFLCGLGSLIQKDAALRAQLSDIVNDPISSQVDPVANMMRAYQGAQRDADR